MLKEMENGTTRVTPDLLSYSGVMSCLAKSKRTADAARAEDVLYRASKAEGVKPDTGEKHEYKETVF